MRRPERARGRGAGPRLGRYALDLERDGLIIHAGVRLPSEALGLMREDVRAGRLQLEGRSSAG